MQSDGHHLAVGDSPAAERNKEPILAVLRPLLPTTGLVLEIASGTGQHIVHFAKAVPNLTWQPTEPDPERLDLIRYRLSQANLSNVNPPLRLNVLDGPWPIDRTNVIVCINMIHIAPWGATQALFQGASQHLSQDGILVLYGPYRRFGHPTAPSNEAFDRDLQWRNPAWGVRDMEAVTDLGQATGLELSEVVEMPSNNFSLVFRKRVAYP